MNARPQITFLRRVLLPWLLLLGGVAAGSLTILPVNAALYGTVVVWGSNDSGQTNVPPKLSRVMAIAGGQYHTLALKRDGTVVAWGKNTQGQTNVPADLRQVTTVSGGAEHSLAGL